MVLGIHNPAGVTKPDNHGSEKPAIPVESGVQVMPPLVFLAI